MNRHRRIHEQQQNGESVENFSEEDLEGEQDLHGLGALEEEESPETENVYLNGAMHAAAHMHHHMPISVTSSGSLSDGLVAVSGGSPAMSMNTGTVVGENGGHHHVVGHGHVHHGHHVLAGPGGMGPPPMMVGQNY